MSAGKVLKSMDYQAVSIRQGAQTVLQPREAASNLPENRGCFSQAPLTAAISLITIATQTTRVTNLHTISTKNTQKHFLVQIEALSMNSSQRSIHVVLNRSHELIPSLLQSQTPSPDLYLDILCDWRCSATGRSKVRLVQLWFPGAVTNGLILSTKAAKSGDVMNELKDSALSHSKIWHERPRQ
ncbi:MAG: hypothetical protein M1830_001771 [Pleopsidium flavum]|nr:MAG: hypothetical protein M1830_001771 [Pleopsidium flavum]